MGIKFENVNYVYQVVNENTIALNDINLNISAQGEFVAIIGHTGSGKSTLIQHMNALLKPSSGKVVIFNADTNTSRNLRSIRKKVGLVFQFPEYQLFEETVEKDIMFGPLNFGSSKEEAKKKTKEVIKLVGLNKSILARSPFTLSGGQMRRVAIAGILAMNPDILILDEPTVGLDPHGQREILTFLNDISKKFNKSIVIVTHDMDVVAEYAKRVVVLKNSKVVFDDVPIKLFKDEQALSKYNLTLPQYMKIIKHLNEELKLNITENCLNLVETTEAVRKRLIG